MKKKYSLENDGFEEIGVEAGMSDGKNYTAGCSNGHSACCTRTCSRDKSFLSNEEDWEKFLEIEGGQVQY